MGIVPDKVSLSALSRSLARSLALARSVSLVQHLSQPAFSASSAEPPLEPRVSPTHIGLVVFSFSSSSCASAVWRWGPTPARGAGHCGAGWADGSECQRKGRDKTARVRIFRTRTCHFVACISQAPAYNPGVSPEGRPVLPWVSQTISQWESTAAESCGKREKAL